MLPPIALLIAILLMGVGSAVDVSRAVSTKSKLASAADAAVLAGARALTDTSLTDAQIKNIASKYFTEITSKLQNESTSSTPTISINRSTGEVSVSATATQKNLFGKLFGFETITLPVSAKAKASGTDIELAMVLDITGSMQGQKLADLKTAAKNVVSILLSSSTSYTTRRISIVPFSEAVNTGPLAKAVTGRSSFECAYERGGTDKFTDTAPTGSSTYFGSAWWVYCPTAEVQGLTTSASTLNTLINSLNAEGGTAGHIGLAWGWYTISPKWTSIFTGSAAPAAYNKAKTQKAIILMTDGDFNTEYLLTNGTSFVQAAALCSAIKSAEVTIYTVAFQAPTAAALFLQTCATSSEHYYETSTGTELATAFQNIANSLNKLKLTE